ncbi:alternative ribosome rescue aminoacyl-tRNA hydrolase ArfB [Altibacter sp.]|uniref:alternative ribosome rescue aminoacyl-tRNA hydrolase ArfB n=1 Tax=Altibacter sp. TaxID=2024823 RepID=UPI000C90C743|nr:alternative ribosome rescue aminoacyl-tRNA hydrolase ArfB [Altibacter sp.]MAP53646.1 aminoacyl-tRNA hydrolase [Altibacter sp.]
MDSDKLIKECVFKAVRSSGPGGQHVNKTASKVEVTFNIIASEALTSLEKERLQKKLDSRITSEGAIQLQCAETRSQHKNKALVIERLIALLKEHLKVVKPRKKTKPSKSAMERRIKTKKQQALKKSNRKPPKLE